MAPPSEKACERKVALRFGVHLQTAVVIAVTALELDAIVIDDGARARPRPR